jgi:hypothetical protein
MSCEKISLLAIPLISLHISQSDQGSHCQQEGTLINTFLGIKNALLTTGVGSKSNNLDVQSPHQAQ